ncbi:DUF2637 domain-containing protein [Haloactinopolyspora alba]|uniref:DUF2637 domain-containing protein n=1 Tax=Haloactinopolyspora alba TaxID=648780 RepID=UPI0013EA18DB|nr:DUF2637 domain-containing protein [Haloactinopolyspora alba]
MADAQGATIHPRFLKAGPWSLAVITAALFGLSFVTSYRALYEYGLELGFDQSFAIAFPLVLDAVTIVLAVALLLERALGRRGITIGGRHLPLPSWPLLALWAYFAGSIAGNVGHAPELLAAQLVAAVPPVSSMLTFHLLLRLLDRVTALRAVAESYEDRQLEAQERAARRAARRSAVKATRKQQQPAQEAQPQTAPAAAEGAERVDESAPSVPAPTVEEAAPSAAAEADGALQPDRAEAPVRRGNQRAEAWEWYQARRAESGDRPSAPELARHLGCSDGQARKLRAYCDDRWSEERRSSLHAVQ